MPDESVDQHRRQAKEHLDHSRSLATSRDPRAQIVALYAIAEALLALSAIEVDA